MDQYQLPPLPIKPPSPRHALLFAFGILVLFRLSTERNTASPYMIRRASLIIEHDTLVWKNDRAALTTDQDMIPMDWENDDDNERSLPFAIHDSKFNATVNGTKDMGDFANDFFQGNMCRTMFNTSSSKSASNIIINNEKKFVSIRFNCQKLFATSIYGTGNFISAVYALRMAANVVGNANIEYVCDDAEHEKPNLILPWLTGWFPANTTEHVAPSVQQACSSYKTVPIGHMYDTMQWELRRMAVALVGIPDDDTHPAKQWAEDHFQDRTRHMQVAASLDDPPIFDNVELDDAVLHFRCGDLISSTHPSFGFMKFGSYSRHLEKTTRSIGILTQPFDEEAIALTFARMIMARQVVIGISSFGVFPGIATFGKAFIRKPDYQRAPNRWLLDNPPIESVAPHVTLVEEPRLMAVTCKSKWQKTNGTAVIDWFQNYTSKMER